MLVLAATIMAVGQLGARAAFGQAPSHQLPAGCSAYEQVPLPAEAENVPAPKTFPACASYRSYGGIGRAVNYDAARACAWQERLAQKAQLSQNQKEPAAWFVGGSLILADIYFNGRGVERNIPLALRFACESDEGMAALALPEIEKLHGFLPRRGPFEFCDYASTTLAMDFCADYASQIADDRASRYYNALKVSMSPEQKAAFDRLLSAEHAYIDAHAFEVYQGGSIRAIRTLGSQRILENLFHAEIVHYERKEWPALSAEQIVSADGRLQREYESQLQELGKESTEDIEDGAVVPENLTRAEKAWDAYREAWAAFAHLRYPTAEAAIRAQITLDRYALVKTIG
jgi:hypothetical protein